MGRRESGAGRGMGRLRRWLRLRAPSGDELEHEVDEEIGLHLELRTAALMRSGLSESEARREATQRFGAGPAIRSRLFAAAARRERRVRMRESLDGVAQDVSSVLRTVVREPGLTAVIVVTLALGIGANATMFGLIDRLLLRGPEHVVAADDVYRFYLTVRSPAFGERSTDAVGYVSYLTFRDGTRSFDGVAAYRQGMGTVGRGATAERASVGAATFDLFPLLGVRAHLGRFFDAEEDRPPAGRNVVVLGYELWRRRFGGDRGVLGESFDVNDEPHTIIGVAPRSFTGVNLLQIDAWIPMSESSQNVTADWTTSWRAQWLKVVGRLKPGVSREQADADATAAHHAAYAGTSERVREARASLRPIRYTTGGREPLEATVSRWLLAVTTIVLLIACANVMNLMLARSTRRRREVAVRLALGIGRGRLFRLLVLHGLVLAAAGGALALVIVRALGPAARTVLLPDIAWTGGPVDSRVLLLTMLAVLFSAAATSVVPALRAGRRDLTRELRSGVREGGGRRAPLRTALTLGQITLTFVLLVGAGLFARSLSTVRSLDLGFEADDVFEVYARWASPASEAAAGTEEANAADRERRFVYYASALERVRAVPGVASAAVAVGTPFRSTFTVHVRVSGHDSIPVMEGGGPYIIAATEGFFETTGLSVVEGRAFRSADLTTGDRVAIVNRTMARTLWPDGALGQCVYLIEGDENAPCSRIIGVVEDAHRFGLREPAAMQYYVPKGQESGFSGEMLLVRSNGADDARVIADIRSALLELDPGLSYVGVDRLQDRIDPQIRPWKLGATLFSLFGVLALLIAAIGLYSVIAYMVADRTHEMGVRKALGADGRAVLALILGHGAWVAIAGLALGTVITLFAGRFIQPALFETSARDPVVFGTVAALTLVVALGASLVPAWRAGRVDPVIALKTE